MELSVMRGSRGWKVDTWRYAMVSQVKDRSIYSWVTVSICGILITLSWYTKQVGS